MNWRAWILTGVYAASSILSAPLFTEGVDTFNSLQRLPHWLLSFYHFFLICVSVWPTYVYAPHVWGTYGGQKRALNPLELELWVDMSHHMGSGTPTWSSARAAVTLNCWSIHLFSTSSLLPLPPTTDFYWSSLFRSTGISLRKLFPYGHLRFSSLSAFMNRCVSGGVALRRRPTVWGVLSSHEPVTLAFPVASPSLWISPHVLAQGPSTWLLLFSDRLKASLAEASQAFSSSQTD